MTGTSIKRRSERGFTLIELVVAMGLLAVALTAVYHLQAKNLDLHAEARFVTRAAQMAKARIADIACREELLEGTQRGVFDEDAPEVPSFRWEESIQELMDREGLYRVQVRVFLENNAGGVSRDLVMETLLYRFGKKG